MKCCYKNLGTKIIGSAAFFETGVASLILSESELLDKLLERNESTDILLEANEQILSITCCLRFLEEAIVEKIKKGMKCNTLCAKNKYHCNNINS